MRRKVRFFLAHAPLLVRRVRSHALFHARGVRAKREARMASGDDGDYGEGHGYYYDHFIGPRVREEIWASIVRVLARSQATVSQARPGNAGAGVEGNSIHSAAIVKALQGVAALHAVGFADKAGAARLTKTATELFAAAGKELAAH
jgi:hypothetical protein